MSSMKSLREKTYGQVDPDKGKILYNEEGTETSVGTLYDDDFLELANVIILQAVEDYAYGYKIMLEVYGSKRKFPTREEFKKKYHKDYVKQALGNIYNQNTHGRMCLYYETLDFFESEWGKFLMRNIKVPLKDIMLKTEKDVEAKMEKKNKFQARGVNTKKAFV